MTTLIAALLLVSASAARTPAESALDSQDRPALEKLAGDAAQAAAAKPDDDSAQYRSALTESALAQLGIELGDKLLGKRAAEIGIRNAQRAVGLKPNVSEYHRILGTLCGQIIPANVLAGMKYGHCATDEVAKAIELDKNSPANWLSRGVGNYYLPPAFGGGVNLAVDDFQKAAQLDPKSPEAYLWLGIALRKSGHNAEARKALLKSLELNPNRRWAKQQLDKTPAQ